MASQFPSLSYNYSPAKMTASMPKRPDLEALYDRGLPPMPSRYLDEDPYYYEAKATWEKMKPERNQFRNYWTYKEAVAKWNASEPMSKSGIQKTKSQYEQELAKWKAAKFAAEQAYIKPMQIFGIDPLSKNKADDLLRESAKLKGANIEGMAQELRKKEKERIAELQMQARADSYPVRVKAQRELDKYAKEGVMGLNIDLPKTKAERDAVVAAMSEIEGKLEILEKQKALQAAKEERVAGFKHGLSLDKLKTTWANTAERDKTLNEYKRQLELLKQSDPNKVTATMLKITAQDFAMYKQEEAEKKAAFMQDLAQKRLEIEKRKNDPTVYGAKKILDAATSQYAAVLKEQADLMAWIEKEGAKETPYRDALNNLMNKEEKLMAGITEALQQYKENYENVDTGAVGQTTPEEPEYDFLSAARGNIQKLWADDPLNPEWVAWRQQQKANMPPTAFPIVDSPQAGGGIPEPPMVGAPAEAIPEPPMIGAPAEVEGKYTFTQSQRKQFLDNIDTYLADFKDNRRIDTQDARNAETRLLLLLNGPAAKANPGIAKKAEAALRSTGRM